VSPVHTQDLIDFRQLLSSIVKCFSSFDKDILCCIIVEFVDKALVKMELKVDG